MSTIRILILALFILALQACSPDDHILSKLTEVAISERPSTPAIDEQPSSPAIVEQPSSPAIIGPDEGEKLILNDGRYVLLKATPKANGSRQLFLGSETLPNGSAIPVHTHDGYDELIFIHKGDANVTLGDRTVRVGPGTTMYIPAGTFHGVENVDPEQTTIVFTFPETEFAEFFRAIGHREGEDPPQLSDEDWDTLMKAHKMRSRTSED